MHSATDLCRFLYCHFWSKAEGQARARGQETMGVARRKHGPQGLTQPVFTAVQCSVSDQAWGAAFLTTSCSGRKTSSPVWMKVRDHHSVPSCTPYLVYSTDGDEKQEDMK